MPVAEGLAYNRYGEDSWLECPRCGEVLPGLSHAECVKCTCNLILARYGNLLEVMEGIEGIEWAYKNPIPVRVALPELREGRSI